MVRLVCVPVRPCAAAGLLLVASRTGLGAGRPVVRRTVPREKPGATPLRGARWPSSGGYASSRIFCATSASRITGAMCRAYSGVMWTKSFFVGMPATKLGHWLRRQNQSREST